MCEGMTLVCMLAVVSIFSDDGSRTFFESQLAAQVTMDNHCRAHFFRTECSTSNNVRVGCASSMVLN